MFLKPDYNLKNVYEINFEELKQQGIKCLMFDLDSTVMVSKSANFLPETLDWFNTFLKDFEGLNPFLKIGMEIFYNEGPELVRELKAKGCKIF